MKVKCALCDQIETIDDDSSLAKKLRNRPIHTYMCVSCHNRITERTKERFESHEYKIHHRMHTKDHEW